MKRLIVGAVALAGLLGACSADETDYKEAAEKYIRSQLGDDSEAECAAPDSKDVGTSFDCTGTAADGSQTAWQAQITKKDEVGVAPMGAVTEGGTEGVEEEPVETVVEEVEEEIEEETES